MKDVPLRKLLILLTALLVCSNSLAQQVVRLYPDDSCRRARNVTLELYPSQGSHTAVVVCPGGSYCWLGYQSEGVDVAKFLQSNGINAFVLRYRVAGWWAWATHYRSLFRGNRQPDMYNDGQAALQWVYDHASIYDIDNDSIGIMGFSAGGHLALSQAVYPGKARPNFAALVYPVVTLNDPYAHQRSRRGLLGDNEQDNMELRKKWSLECNIPHDCPPVFVVNCLDDPTVDYHNSIMLCDSLKAKNIPYLYLQYPTGGHGFGVSETKGSEASRKWKWEFLKWLRDLKHLY